MASGSAEPRCAAVGSGGGEVGEQRRDDTAEKLDGENLHNKRLDSVVQELIGMPEDKELLEFYMCKLLSRATPFSVSLDVPGGKGKGGVACQVIQKGQLMLREQPLVSLQNKESFHEAPTCAQCHHYVGSIPFQVARRLQAIDPKQHALMIDALLSGTLVLPSADKFRLPPALKCPGCPMLFCSHACYDAAWARHHCVMCPATDLPPPAPAPEPQEFSFSFAPHAPAAPGPPAPETTKARRQKHDPLPLGAALPPLPACASAFHIHRSAWAAFDAYAATSEVHAAFPLVAQLLAQTLVAASAAVDADPSHDTAAALKHAWLMRGAAAGMKRPWWEARGGGEGPEARREQLQPRVERAVELLRGAFYDPRFEALFSPEVFSAVLGMLELNSLELYVPPVVEDYLMYVHKKLPKEEWRIAQSITKPIESALDEDHVYACDGHAVYHIQSCLNHSCCPNSSCERVDGLDVDGAAVVRATRRIEKGEEITISYIDTDLPFEQRQAELQEYGFTCACPKCEDERSQRE